MRILLLGSGGREHAMALKISESPACDVLYIAPGNAGTARCGKNVNIQVNDFPAIAAFAMANSVQMLIVGPEDPLVNGIADYFQQEKLSHIAVIGPDRSGAQLEGSKLFAKEFMQKYNIPTARFRSFTVVNIEEGYAFIDELSPPYVLKASGLAAGKGVLILENKDEAKEELYSILYKDKFGAAGKEVVIEEFLKGIECSAFVITDGRTYRMLPYAKDYKRIGEGDTGLNTGGMGAVSPVAFADAAFREKVEERIVKPTVAGIQMEGMKYKGFVFVGLMNVNGNPFVIEYNCRMGDPETEVVFPRIRNDIVELFSAVASGKLDETTLIEDTRNAVTVVMVSGGYPGNYDKGFEIKGSEDVNESIVFHAGTALKDQILVTAGGRVLAVTSLDDTLQGALNKSYRSARKINFDFAYYRNDIGKDLLSMPGSA